MFFRIKKSPSGQCLQLLESYRNAQGQPRHRVVVSLGDASIAEVDRPLVARLSNVAVRVNLPLKVSAAKALYAGKDLPVRRAAGGGVEFLVPHVQINEVVSLEQS